MSQDTTSNRQEQIVNSGLIYKNGLAISYASASTVTVGSGQCRDSTNTFDIFVPSFGQTPPLVCSTSFVGANGLDEGTVQPNTTYGLFVLLDTTYYNKPAVLLSTSFTSPIMPSVNGVTYGAFRLIDFVTTDGSSNILHFYNTVNNSTIYKQFDAPQQVLSGAAAVFTPVSLSPFVPNVDYARVTLNVSYLPHTAGDTASFRPTGGTGVTHIFNAASLNADTETFSILPLTSAGHASIDYMLSSITAPANLVLSVVGYEFNV